MLKLYFLRHGQTELNEKELVQGWNDSELTDLGLFQAKCTGFGLKDIQFHKVYSGDSGRQIATAEAFLSQNINNIPQIIKDSHFREKSYGKFEYYTYLDMVRPLLLRHNEALIYDNLFKHYDDLQIAYEVSVLDDSGKSETPDMVWDRFSKGLDMIVSENSGGNILISTSSVAIAVVIDHLFPEFKDNGIVDNASITVISYQDGKYYLDDFNNTSYRKIGEQHIQKDF